MRLEKNAHWQARRLGWCWVGVLAAFAGGACDDGDTRVGGWTPPTSGGALGSGGVASGGQGGEPSVEVDALYLEAEAGTLIGDFAVGTADTASSGEFIESSVDVASDEEPGTGRARYDFELSVAGEYVIWGRTHGPEPGHSRYFLRVDGGAWIPWRIATGDAWYWDDMHRDADYGRPLIFTLATGAHSLEIGNSDVGAELDRIYVTGRGDVPPGNDTPCNPPHSIEQGGTCVRACGTYGKTSCGTDVCAGRPLFAVYDCEVCCQVE